MIRTPDAENATKPSFAARVVSAFIESDATHKLSLEPMITDKYEGWAAGGSACASRVVTSNYHISPICEPARIAKATPLVVEC
eukprot:SAG31_NODE_33672_length_341_cov_0.822314_1_plen_83_part_00